MRVDTMRSIKASDTLMHCAGFVGTLFANYGYRKASPRTELLDLHD